jgi:hypothetical protein
MNVESKRIKHSFISVTTYIRVINGNKNGKRST